MSRRRAQNAAGLDVPLAATLGRKPFDRQEEPVPETPEQERDAGTVPEAAQGEDDEPVEAGSGRAAAAAAERYVEVVAKPRRKRDMPSAPELAHGTRGVKAED